MVANAEHEALLQTRLGSLADPQLLSSLAVDGVAEEGAGGYLRAPRTSNANKRRRCGSRRRISATAGDRVLVRVGRMLVARDWRLVEAG